MSTVFGTAQNDCCSPVVSPPTVPRLISNPPGLSAIQYRIGTFTSFRRAMLEKIALPDLMAGAVTTLARDVAPTDSNISIVDVRGFPATAPFRIKIGTEYMLVTGSVSVHTWIVARTAPQLHSIDDAVILCPVNPFDSWHEDVNGDYQTMFLELWAYLGDVLTFYQERIANEAFLGTATQRDSLLRLVNLIDYRPGPGAAAGGLVALTVAKNKSVTVPAGLRIGSRPAAGKPAVVFETASTVALTDDNNAIALALFSPDVPFDAGTIVLQGINSRIAVNDFVLVVEREGTADEDPHLLQVVGVSTDKATNRTEIRWRDPFGKYQQASKQVSFYNFEVNAAPFGASAPRWDTLPPGLTTPANKAPYPDTWDSPLKEVVSTVVGTLAVAGTGTLVPNPMYFVPLPQDPPNQIFLDSAYEQLKFSATNPGWAALQTDGGMFQTFRVTDARQVSKVAYSLSAKSTRLTLDASVSPLTFPFRSSMVLTGNVGQPVQINLPLADPVSGSRILLSGIHAGLQDGQTVLLRGNLFPGNQPDGESATIAGPALFDTTNNLTVINLKRPLAKRYFRASCSLLANIVEVTQGETVKDEILGSGDGSAFQSYPLKKSPLTYLPSADPESLSAVDSALIVTVDGVVWSEQRSLVDSTSDAQDYTTSLDDTDVTSVVFGDGYNGARPSRGLNNIHAHYRRGLGTSGNLAPDNLQQLVDSIPDLQKATNPIPTSGGADPDDANDIRQLAPGSLQTFGRAVSASDYAALALSYPGIAKASATRVLQDPVTMRAVPTPYVQVTAATIGRVPLQGNILAGKLRRFLDSHRDPNVPLRIQDFTPVFIAVAVTIDINSRFPHQGTLNLVQAALNPAINSDGTAGYFAFESLEFGQSIFLSSLYAAVQAIEGVDDVIITTLRRVGPSFGDPASGPPHDIVVRPTELVTIDSNANPESTLNVSARGGFDDT